MRRRGGAMHGKMTLFDTSHKNNPSIDNPLKLVVYLRKCQHKRKMPIRWFQFFLKICFTYFSRSRVFVSNGKCLKRARWLKEGNLLTNQTAMWHNNFGSPSPKRIKV